MAESKFKRLQEDVCYKEPEEIPEPDKICPTCIPNENYTPPNWRLTREPYLDESKCLYMIKVNINIDGDIYYAARASEGVEPEEERYLTPIQSSPYNQNTLLKSYIRPAVRKLLRYYSKLETDEIVCARPPQNPGEVCEGVHGVDYEEYITQVSQRTDEPVPNFVEILLADSENLLNIVNITNPDALELFARVEDYDYLTNAKILSVLVGIPAYKFDAVPQAPDLGSLNTSNDKIVIRPPEFMSDIISFKSAMSTFAKYQAFFKQQENGRIYYEETSDPYYIKWISDTGGKIDKFLENFESLLRNNGFKVRGLLDTGLDLPDIAYEIEISFDKSIENLPFAIQNVRARKRNCPYVECKVGLDSFINYSKRDQTMFGYIANLKSLASSLSNNKTPPWIDFVVANTYPQLAVNYGSSGNFEDTCVNNAPQDLEDFILNETIDAFKAIEYRYNQNRCKKPEDIQSFNDSLTNFIPDITSDVNVEIEKIKKAFGEKTRKIDQFRFETLIDKIDYGLANISDLLSFINPCDIKASMTIAMKCIMAGLTAEEAYRAIIKQLISSAGEEALEIILQSLPANQQQKIRAEVERQFGNFPFPWEPGWEGGDLGGAVDRQSRENLEDKQERYQTAEDNSSSLLKRIEKLEKRKEELFRLISMTTEEFKTSPEYIRLQQELEQYGENPLEETRRLQEDIDLKEAKIELINFVLKELEDRQVEEELQLEIDPNDQDAASKLILINQSIAEEKTKRQAQQNFIDINIRQIERLKPLVEILQLVDNPDMWQNSIIMDEYDLNEQELLKLKSQKTKEDVIVRDLEEYSNFIGLPEEDQQRMIEEQREKTFLVKTTPEDQIRQGTLGKSLGNVQKALTQAYIDEIMKSATIGDLQRAIENIPGSNILGTIIAQFHCPNGAVIYPPIDSFLSTLTLDPCGGTSPRLSLPSIQNIPLSWNWLEALGEAFMFGIKQIVSAILVALMRKVAELVNTDLCKLSGNLLRAAADGGLEGVIGELICDDPRPGDTQDKINQKVLEAGGARKRNPEDYKAVASVLSVSATQREIKAAMVGRADQDFLNNMSSIVSAVVPNFADVFGDPSSVANYFSQMGNLLTQEQRNVINDQLNSPFDDNFPVETSICLTKEQKDLWDQERASAFQDPDLGREFVNKQNEKALNDLSDAADLLLNGVNLDDALAKAFNPKDPDCKTNSGVVPGFQDLPQDKQKTVLTATEGLFKRLEKAFIDDTVEGNFFEFTDPPGILLSILADRANRNIDLHIAIKNNPLLRLIFLPFGGSADLPETVGIRMKNQIDQISGDYAIEPLIENKTSFSFDFSNGKEGNKAFSDSVEIGDNTADNSIKIRDQFRNVTVPYDLEIPEEFSVTNEEARALDSSRAAMLKKLLEHNWSKFADAEITEDDVTNIFHD